MTKPWRAAPPARAGTKAFVWYWTEEVLATWTVIDGGMSYFWLTDDGMKLHFDATGWFYWREA